MVEPGETFCYEAPYRFDDEQEFTIILELTTKTNLKIEKRNNKNCDNGPWNFVNPTLFER
ncbi:hypothetical protein GOV05_01720 [Candidatus Woesearchaeota archaeon]|nr:hypothetical protein [Candidatus Woesearchaeota archaeon]